MALDQENLRRQNDELTVAYKEKNRKLLQAQELYDKLKRKAMLGHIQDAASDAVDTTLHGDPTLAVHPLDRVVNQRNHNQQFGTPYGATSYADRLDQSAAAPGQPRMAPPGVQNVPWARSAPSQSMCRQYPRYAAGSN